MSLKLRLLVHMKNWLIYKRGGKIFPNSVQFELQNKIFSSSLVADFFDHQYLQNELNDL